MNARDKRARDRLKEEARRAAEQANALLSERNEAQATARAERAAHEATRVKLDKATEEMRALRYEHARYDARTDAEARLQAEVERLTDLLKCALTRAA